MKRFNFGNFLVDESNRDAFEICQDIAGLKPTSPMPVTLLADAECGKTHLLYSIVNRVRTTSARAGLAYVTAHDFPDPVRSLIDDPAPVERATAAILLVDQLESFSALTEELEAVVRIFLDNGHYVVLASSVHPGRLMNLPPGLRALAEAGQMIQMLPRPETRVELLTRRGREESEAELTRQREEIQELRTLLERVGKGGRSGEADDTTALRAQLDAERGANDDLNRKLGIAKAYCDSVQDELMSVRSALERFQRDAASGSESRGALSAEVTSLRAQLEQSEATAAESAERYRQAQAELNELASVGDELLQLRAQFEALKTEKIVWNEERARVEAELARAELIENAAQALRSQLETAQADATELRAEVQRQQTELNSLATVSAELSQLRSRLETIETERLAALAAREDQRQQLDSKRAEVDALHAQVTSLSGQLEMSRDESRRARDDANELVRRAESLIAQIEANRVTFAQAEEERQRQIEELELLASQHGTSAVSAEDWAAAQARLNELEHALDEASRDRAAQKDILRQAQDNLEAALLRAEEETTAAQAARAQAMAEHEQSRGVSEQLKSQLAELKLRYEQVESERDAFGVALQNAINERDTLEAASDQANAERMALRSAVEQIRAERDSLSASVERFTDERNALNLALGRSTEERDTLNGAYQESVRREQDLSTRLETALGEAESMRAAYAQSEQEREALATSLQEARRDAEHLGGALEALKHEAAAQVAGAHAQAGELEGRIHRLRMSFDHTGETIKTASSDLGALRHQLLAATDDLARLATELGSVSDQMVLEEAEFPTPARGAGNPRRFEDEESDSAAFSVSQTVEDREGDLLDSLSIRDFAPRDPREPLNGGEVLESLEAPTPGFQALPNLAILNDEPEASI